MGKKYILYGDNIYYIDNNDIISVEYYTGEIRNGYSKDVRFYIPILKNGVFLENATAIEIKSAKKAETIEFLDRMVSKVKLYIKAMAMGKSIHDNLTYYEEAYTNKYKLCVKLKDYLDNGVYNPDPFNTIATEAQLEGQTTIEFINNVVAKFEQGKVFNDNGIQLIECLRKRIYLDLDLELFDTAKARLELIDNLPATITPADVAGIYNNVMTL